MYEREKKKAPAYADIDSFAYNKTEAATTVGGLEETGENLDADASFWLLMKTFLSGSCP